MFRYAALFVVAVCVAGCDINLSSLRPVKWATVDVNKVRVVVADGVKAENPYPAELEGANGLDEEYTRTRSQIASLRSAASEKCQKSIVPPVAKDAVGYGQAFHGGRVSLDSDFTKCIRLIDEDQLIIDLNSKIQAHDKRRQQKAVHDREVARKIEQRVRDVVAAYGKSNGYELLIEERGAGVIYNSSDLVVDVTGGVLESLKR